MQKKRYNYLFNNIAFFLSCNYTNKNKYNVLELTSKFFMQSIFEKGS